MSPISPDRFGRAQFGYRLRAGAFGGTSPMYLTFMARASTPTAMATKRIQLRLPVAFSG